MKGNILVTPFHRVFPWRNVLTQDFVPPPNFSILGLPVFFAFLEFMYSRKSWDPWVSPYTHTLSHTHTHTQTDRDRHTHTHSHSHTNTHSEPHTPHPHSYTHLHSFIHRNNWNILYTRTHPTTGCYWYPSLLSMKGCEICSIQRWRGGALFTRTLFPSCSIIKMYFTEGSWTFVWFMV